MKLLNEPILRHGLVIIPKQQVTGIGNFFLNCYTLKFDFNVTKIKKNYAFVEIIV